MQEREVVDLDKWLENRKTALKNAPLEIRPKKLDKGIKSRSFEERLALAKACKEAWDNAIASGRIKKTIDSYELC